MVVMAEIPEFVVEASPQDSEPMSAGWSIDSPDAEVWPLADGVVLPGNWVIAIDLQLRLPGCGMFRWNQTTVAYFCGDAGETYQVRIAVGEGRYAIRATVVSFEGEIVSSPLRVVQVGPEGQGLLEGVSVVTNGRAANFVDRQGIEAQLQAEAATLSAIREECNTPVLPNCRGGNVLLYQQCGEMADIVDIAPIPEQFAANDTDMTIDVRYAMDAYGISGLPAVSLYSLHPIEGVGVKDYEADLTATLGDCTPTIARERDEGESLTLCQIVVKLPVSFPHTHVLIINWFNVTCEELGLPREACKLSSLRQVNADRLAGRTTRVFSVTRPVDPRVQSRCEWSIDDPRAKPQGLDLTTGHLDGCTSCWLNGQYQKMRSSWKWRGSATTPLMVGAAKQLLVDDDLVEDRLGLVSAFGTPDIGNGGQPVLEADGEWEYQPDKVQMERNQAKSVVAAQAGASSAKPRLKTVSFYGSVHHENGTFRLWYRVMWRRLLCYAESSDGVHWTKPAIQPDGSNVVMWTESASVHYDTHELDLAHRFKMTLGSNTTEATIAYSGDGLNWTPYRAGYASVTHRASDTYNTLRWLPDAQTYLLVTRTDFATGEGWREIRGIRFMTNPDPKSHPADWTTVSEWYLDREGKNERCRRQLYSFVSTLHEGVYFAFIAVLEHPRDLSEGLIRAGVPTPLDLHTRHDVYLSTSRDGLHWDLSAIYEGKPFIPRGGNGTWYKDGVDVASSFVTVGDRHWIYFSGRPERHQFGWQYEQRIGFATLARDRFIGLAHQPMEKGGTFGEGMLTTKVLRVEHPELILNVNASLGSVAVEVILVTESDERIATGFSQRECAMEAGVDSIATRVRWRRRGGQSTGMAQFMGQAIRLRFYLRMATLYALQFTSIMDGA